MPLGAQGSPKGLQEELPSLPAAPGVHEGHHVLPPHLRQLECCGEARKLLRLLPCRQFGLDLPLYAAEDARLVEGDIQVRVGVRPQLRGHPQEPLPGRPGLAPDWRPRGGAEAPCRPTLAAVKRQVLPPVRLDGLRVHAPRQALPAIQA
eukprot:CAMPEP_0175597484 /NCGR_PEP_ID=MMETSP0096-20121207/56061_1 /TAXON_ID=311494 /ORGANISM="Alexandrium monilatum, Strain CCMP3105" /LENGTH=148 /DNA_ID=CAMNT_0016901959 /DNA_START=207 /DNA_END=649 /DNA_ORIENTATION=+